MGGARQEQEQLQVSLAPPMSLSSARADAARSALHVTLCSGTACLGSGNMSCSIAEVLHCASEVGGACSHGHVGGPNHYHA